MRVYYKIKNSQTIKIKISGGVITDVHNLPDGYNYQIVDHDDA